MTEASGNYVTVHKITGAGKALLQERLEKSQHIAQVGLARIRGALT